MSKVVINCYEDFEQLLGKEIGSSDYLQVDQWIHVDEERCKTESPFHQTIVHGYLTLSLLPYLWDQIIQVNNLERLVNYGMDKMKFGQPVLSGQSVRMTTHMESLANLRGAIRMSIRFNIDIKETGKTALEGVATFIYFFKKS